MMIFSKLRLVKNHHQQHHPWSPMLDVKTLVKYEPRDAHVSLGSIDRCESLFCSRYLAGVMMTSTLLLAFSWRAKAATVSDVWAFTTCS